MDVRNLATLLTDPRELSAEAMDRAPRSTTCVRVADRLSSCVVAKRSDEEALRQDR